MRRFTLLPALLLAASTGAVPALPGSVPAQRPPTAAGGDMLFSLQDLARTLPGVTVKATRFSPSSAPHDPLSAAVFFPGTTSSLLLSVIPDPQGRQVFTSSSLLGGLSTMWNASKKPAHVWSLNGWPHPVLSVGTYRVQLGTNAHPAAPSTLYGLFAHQVCGFQRGLNVGNTSFVTTYDPESGDFVVPKAVGYGGRFEHLVTLRGHPNQAFLAVTTQGGTFSIVTHTGAQGRARLVLPMTGCGIRPS
ncbi:hypothetical protein [Deinococcus planocerae]|uniref:hypothetical protein n=1 Tax=Deinococcus planocerae TaxID=1737569 RepID=UPI000C7F747C|nr:hypothetical protein [Deinococcus planocerae]